MHDRSPGPAAHDPTTTPPLAADHADTAYPLTGDPPDDAGATHDTRNRSPPRSPDPHPLDAGESGRHATTTTPVGAPGTTYANADARDPEPPGPVTDTPTTPEPAGDTASIRESDTTTNDAASTPPKRTPIASANPDPVITTDVPPAPAPEPGTTPDTTGGSTPSSANSSTSGSPWPTPEENGDAAARSASHTCDGDHPGFAPSSRAAAPATCGAAMLVPLFTLDPPPTRADVIDTPGA